MASTLRCCSSHYRSLRHTEETLITTNESSFLASAALRHSLRSDGRRLDQVRPHQLHLLRSEDGSSTATVLKRGTRVSCSCKGQVVPVVSSGNSRDRSANEGQIVLSVHLSPGALFRFRPARPAMAASSSTVSYSSSTTSNGPTDEHQKHETNQILRTLERLLLTSSNILDPEALCIVPCQWVWRLDISISVLDAAGGNVLDAAVLATMASLRHFRVPCLDLNTGSTPKLISTDVKEPTPLPLQQTPLALSISLVADDKQTGNSTSPCPTFLVDPSRIEQDHICETMITIAMNGHGEICLLDVVGGELPPNLLRTLHHTARRVLVNEQCSALEKTLEQADEQARKERLHRILQEKQQGSCAIQNEDTAIPNVPFYHSASETVIELPPKENEQKHDNDDEEYRRQALEYNLGHVAAKVKENTLSKKEKTNRQASRLLQALLQSVSGQNTTTKPSNEEESLDTTRKEPTAMDTTRETAAKQSTATRLDSDEESTTQLMNPVFATTVADDRKTEDDKKDPVPRPIQIDDDGDDIDDLAAAVVKKKKKSSKKKTSRK